MVLLLNCTLQMVGSVNYNSMKLKKQNLKIVRGLENGTVVECLLRIQQ